MSDGFDESIASLEELHRWLLHMWDGGVSNEELDQYEMAIWEALGQLKDGELSHEDAVALLGSTLSKVDELIAKFDPAVFNGMYRLEEALNVVNRNREKYARAIAAVNSNPSEPITGQQRIRIEELITDVMRQVDGSNELTPRQKANVRGYLQAANEIVKMPDVDRSALMVALEWARNCARRFGAHAIETGIDELIRLILDNLPF